MDPGVQVTGKIWRGLMRCGKNKLNGLCMMSTEICTKTQWVEGPVSNVHLSITIAVNTQSLNTLKIKMARIWRTKKESCYTILVGVQRILNFQPWFHQMIHWLLFLRCIH